MTRGWVILLLDAFARGLNLGKPKPKRSLKLPKQLAQTVADTEGV